MNSETPETDAAVRECHNLPDIVTTDGPFRYVPADFARRLELRNRRLMEALHSIVEEATRVTPSEDVALGNMATGADPLLQLERAIGIGDRQAHIEDIERYQVEIAALKTRAEKAEAEVAEQKVALKPFINLAKGKCTCGGWSSTEHSDWCVSKQLETFLAKHPELW